MPKKENAEAKKGRQQQEKQELRERRSRQLTEARNAAEELNGDVHKIHLALRRGEALASHSAGFYEEVSKLAKIKIPLGVTDRMVDEANNIIKRRERHYQRRYLFGASQRVCARGGQSCLPGCCC